MAKADSVFQLSKAALERNHEMVVQSIRVMVATEPSNSSLKHRLKSLLERYQRSRNEPDSKYELPSNVKNLVTQLHGELTLGDVSITPEVKAQVESMIEDYQYHNRLVEYGLSPRNRLLLSGEPGTGKTTLAAAIAQELSLPCFVIKYGSLIDSHFGGTGSRLQTLFHSLTSMPCVIFLDEMETLLCERSRANSGNDIGEMSRVVTTLLQIVDSLPNDVLFFGATNHPEMLDKAVKRRFDVVIQMPEFISSMVDQLVKIWRSRYPLLPVSTLVASISLSEIRTPADLERAFLTVARDHVKSTFSSQGVCKKLNTGTVTI